MKASELFYPTLREVPNEAEIISHQLLLRAGFIRKASAGIYSYLPLANRVLKKIMDIVREEMDNAGAQEIIMPIVQPKELWEKSGRWSVYGDEMFRLKDRHERDFALGPTHEEIVTAIVDADVHSYRDMPVMLYQIQNKYRDEIRPRFGLMRGREFIMKDCYSFDNDYDALDISYKKMYEAYKNIYERMNLKFRVVEADSGAIGGSENHEFMVLADNGESVIVYCDECNYAANIEKAECKYSEDNIIKEEFLDITKVSTPEQKSINEVSNYLNIPTNKLLKTMLYVADGELIAIVLRGDRELNEIKLKNSINCNHLDIADENRVKEEMGFSFGYVGPVGLDIKVYADIEVSMVQNLVCGANEDGFHLINVNMGRDFTPEHIIDIRNAVEGDKCPECSNLLQATRGIEVGHIFKLGTKYSESMNATFLDQNGTNNHMIMGCYGIGVSRSMAAAIEQNYDENGIIWPLPIAPYHVIIVPVNVKKDDQLDVAMSLYEQLKEKGIEVIIDDRDERAGVKFKDADLIGIPMRVTIGPKSLKENKVEFKKRWEKESELIDIYEIVNKITNIIDK
ncbi:Prolyl-tRNA synthetase [Candidatus Syntrophocurvum alkaliphilum]|uniref:Proline--tRNA ligase n=1 Tax=Candidatus Syntrophocurvum alkaliphilum TaxID=2293317 RepID=A0A6I6D828_9FIRM|nr:proline--tRNA ligase [Candidatus Syntrophocurvum alkaliphilum]QGT99206.1 Prolyl-tRNA synthetase [Candidatus Syntrophocurvum alkaliphilum]